MSGFDVVYCFSKVSEKETQDATMRILYTFLRVVKHTAHHHTTFTNAHTISMDYTQYAAAAMEHFYTLRMLAAVLRMCSM